MATGTSSPRRGRPRWSWRVTTVAGIDIRIHATFLILVLLVALGSTAPEGPGLFSGLSWLVALFTCVVVHELAHSVVAQHHDIPIVEIELLPIGGVSKMSRTPDDPGVELRIALAGPAASVGLGALFAAAAYGTGADLWPPSLYDGGFVARLAWVNLLLAGFNLLPALPLDGGRVLRAVLEQHLDRQRATAVAARVARFLASVMIVVGVLVNVWIMVIGMFVYLGSLSEEAAATIHERIKDLHVSDAMIRSPLIVRSDDLALSVRAVLWHGAQREFPVLGADGSYVGLVTAEDLVRAEPGRTMGSLADPTHATLRPDDRLEASGLLTGELHAAAVISAGRVVGLARAADAVLVAQQVIRRAEPAR